MVTVLRQLPHFFQLCFLEVRARPHTVNLNHDDKLLPLRNSGADFRTTLIHDPVDRGHDMAVAHVEQGRSAIRRQLKSQLLLPRPMRSSTGSDHSSRSPEAIPGFELKRGSRSMVQAATVYATATAIC